MSLSAESPDPDDLDDFAAECDEHLTAARQVLVDWESETGGVDGFQARDRVATLFRHFHTVKGLSAMVGARAAEGLAHQLETHLGSVRGGRVPLADTSLDLLLQGVAAIEAAVAAYREGRPAPDSTALVARVSALSLGHGGESPVPSAAPPAPLAEGGLPPSVSARLAALPVNRRLWRVGFTPAQELAARGVNVNTVRGRLQAAGEVVHAEPAPAPGGGVRFTFLFAAPADFDPTELVTDGLTAEPYHPPAAPSPDEGPPSNLSAAPVNLVRVDLGRLDDLLRVMGELVLSRAKLDAGLARAAAYLPDSQRAALAETAQAIERHVRDLREGVMRVRLVPVRTLFARMRLVVRDLARDAGQTIDLAVAGEGTEIDKFVAERMAEPLLHLVRNAVSHGAEPAAERVAAGKPPQARLTLRAAADGGTVVLEVVDDGRGVDADAVFARARAAGLAPADAPTDPAAVLDLLCTPGFSTRDAADRASGRGVGMDVVRRVVEELGGALALDTRPGAGTRFTARLPLTLVVADVLTVTVGDRMYAVPQAAVREVFTVEPAAVVAMENNELVRYHGRVLPLVRLGDLLGVPRPAGGCVALVVGEGAAAVALAADRAVGLREAVVRPLSDPLVQVPGFGGATELGDGRPVLLLDPPGLARLARRLARQDRPGG